MDQGQLQWCLVIPCVVNRALFVLLLYYSKRSYDLSLNAAIYLTSQSMHHLLTTQTFVRPLDYIMRNTAIFIFFNN